ncbi:MAG: DNA-binding response regulator [Rhodocyclales bacterium]|nr:DNA-binding response regulator [Rhodocyclales bacterium]
MRLLLVEDDEPLANTLATSLRQGGYAVDWMANGNDAESALQTQTYDALILDLNLPGRDGFQVLQRLRARGTLLPVLILSARDATQDRVASLDLGADDYITKPFDLPELEARLRALIRRSRGRSGSKIAIDGLELDTVARRATVAGTVLDLTAREYGLLELLVVQADQAVSKSQLIASLCEWGEEMSSNAIDIQIHRLRRKLDGSGTAIRTLRGFGYLIESADGG